MPYLVDSSLAASNLLFLIYSCVCEHSVAISPGCGVRMVIPFLPSSFCIMSFRNQSPSPSIRMLCSESRSSLMIFSDTSFLPSPMPTAMISESAGVRTFLINPSDSSHSVYIASGISICADALPLSVVATDISPAPERAHAMAVIIGAPVMFLDPPIIKALPFFPL